MAEIESVGRPSIPTHVRGRALARNTAINLAGQILPLAVTVAVLPLVIRALGLERFGVLSLISIVTGYLYVFDLGLGRAVTRSVSQALSTGALSRLRTVTHTALIAESVLGVIAGLILGATAPALVSRILNIPENLRSEALTSLYILMLSLPIVFAAGPFRGALEAAQRFDLVNMVTAPALAINAVIPLAAVQAGLSLPGIVVFQVIFSVVILIVYASLTIHLFPSLRRLPRFYWDEFCGLMSFGGWITVSNITGPLLLYLDRFLIGALLTVADVAYYAAPFQVIIRLWLIPTSLVMTLFPAFSAFRMGERPSLHELYFRSTRYLLLVAGPVILLLVVFARDILGIWLGTDFATTSALVFRILLMGAFVGLLAPVSSVLLQGVGRPDISPKLYALYLPLNAAVVWILVQRMGIVGGAISFAFRTAIDALLLTVISLRLLRVPYRTLQQSRLLRSLGVIIGSGVLLWSAIRAGSPPVAVSLVAWTVVFSVTAWRYALDETDRRAIMSITGKSTRAPSRMRDV